MSMNFLDIQAFVHREARLLDDREWDAWLECYSKNVVFWMPAWDDDDRLTQDPQSEISLIYYPNREGLEDRVYRIKTERSGATSIPEPRTTHQISNLEVLSQDGDKVELRFNWHTLSHRYQQTNAYFGTSFYTLDVSGDTPLIERKTVILNNDYIHQVIDVYHI
ncbi:benzoate 1,2-dioxygenase small subunit [Modicisalibacter xianhensis]|uniref:Benzoate/toluate 1,2-dioxygenase beta subunit n=1 Tax=Modicisalibacter xianhensis TaxID=442341 RepID=A0A1I2Z3X9_9GAMM|nr:benzoate 1,2-dioxygenase small subunit [Halomonas xianhensis]TDX27665.1 benzoate/toluate 1,2-dioxygenase beta subunit [Halomonas xianhensis]SFH32249.1 benzoate/toluate 1,2-dioxygenase beta subunit [Halomonas xianhensis]